MKWSPFHTTCERVVRNLFSYYGFEALATEKRIALFDLLEPWDYYTNNQACKFGERPRCRRSAQDYTRLCAAFQRLCVHVEDPLVDKDAATLRLADFYTDSVCATHTARPRKVHKIAARYADALESWRAELFSALETPQPPPPIDKRPFKRRETLPNPGIVGSFVEKTRRRRALSPLDEGVEDQEHRGLPRTRTAILRRTLTDDSQFDGERKRDSGLGLSYDVEMPAKPNKAASARDCAIASQMTAGSSPLDRHMFAQRKNVWQELSAWTLKHSNRTM